MRRIERLKIRRREKRQLALKIAMVVILLGGLAAGIMNFSAVKTWAARHYVSFRLPPPIPQDNPVYPDLYSWDPTKPLNILLVGIDRGSVPGEEGYTRSDVIILASINIELKKAVLVSIPRDTKVTIPGHGTDKINAAHSYNGPVGALQAVKGLSGLEINHYAEVDFEAFKDVVDAIGGVPFHVEQTIDDPKVGYLPEGDYVLDGRGALIVCRSRDYPEGDLERIENQKRFLKAAMEKISTVRDTQALLKILDAAVKYLQTTMNAKTILNLAESLQGMKVEDVQFATLPGSSPTPRRGQPWYYIPDEQATAQLFSNIRDYCSTKTPEEEAAEKALQEQQRAAEEEARAALEAAEATVDRSSVGVMVLNGARQEGLAAEVARAMEERGYGKVNTGNSRNAYPVTTIYYAPGREAEARVASRDLEGDKDFRVVQDAEIAGSNQADVVLVIGKDFDIEF